MYSPEVCPQEAFIQREYLRNVSHTFCAKPSLILGYDNVAPDFPKMEIIAYDAYYYRVYAAYVSGVM
jgi:hypothetical protein